MDLVQQRAAPHGDLAVQETIFEQRHHSSTQQQILLDLVLGRPRHGGLVSQNVLAGDGSHGFSSLKLLSTWCRRASRMPFVAAPPEGMDLAATN